MPAKTILTETAVTPQEAEVLACYLAAARAATQAASIHKKLAPRVLAMAKKYPGLLFDSARIKPATRKVWTYNTAAAVMQAEMELDRAQRLQKALVENKSDLAEATVATVEFPKVEELAKLADQVPEKYVGKAFVDLFTQWRKKP